MGIMRTTAAPAMARVVLAMAAAVGAATVGAAPAGATVFGGGSFGADEYVFVTDGIGLGVGTYRFDVRFTAAPVYAFGDVINTVTDVFFCVDPTMPGGPFYCGGDDVPLWASLQPETSTVYSALMRVGPTYLSGDPNGWHMVHSESCCAVQFDFLSQAAGSYELSVTQVPEPASWAVMIGGMALAGGSLRRRQAVAARA